MEEHRKNPTCAACHKIMDPIGFSLDNFDLIGTWRAADSGEPIDATGQLVDGTKLDGPASLRNALLSRSDVFVRTVTEKLLTYATGRALKYYDMPVVRSIAREAAQERQSFFGARPRYREERSISDENEAIRVSIPRRTAMRFITKKHLPRRTFLRGMGVTVALPLLDSMVPAQTPLARTAANPASRLSCIYVPHGATMYKWTPTTEGPGFAFTETLAPLEKLRDRITWSRTWRIRPLVERVRMPAPITRVRPRCF